MSGSSKFSGPAGGDRDRERLRAVRALGARRFILTRGVLGWGGLMFVICTVLPAFRLVPWFQDTAEHPAVFVPVGAVIWLAGGALFGWLLWRTIARRFAELDNDASDDE